MGRVKLRKPKKCARCGTAAVEYTINTLLANDEFYSGRSREFLEKAAKNSISERLVVGA